MKINKKMHADARSLNLYAVKAAKRLGLPVMKRAGFESPPQELCQLAVAHERAVARVASRRFRTATSKGRSVYFLTVCRPEWTCDAGSLSPTMVRDVVQWMTRHARNLSKTAQHRMMGFVDIAWNDRSGVEEDSHWCVHAHAIIRLKLSSRYDAERPIKRAFACRGDAIRVKRPVHLARLATSDDVSRVTEYCSRAILLKFNRGRWSYVSEAGERGTRKVSLPTARQLEIDRVISQIGPRGFWILSGLRRKGDVIDLHDSTIRATPHDADLRRRKQ